MIDEKKFAGRASGFIVYNNQIAKDIIDSVDDMPRAGEIIVVYHYKADVLLIHPATYYGRKGACSAIKQVLKEIEGGDIHCEENDKRIREILIEPEFSTQKVLSAFLRLELKKLS